MTVTGPKAKPFLGGTPRGVSAAGPGAFSSQVETLGDSENATNKGAFSSQVETLGDSENATKQGSIFKPSGNTWRLGKCDQTREHFQAKWKHLAARKMRPNKGAFSSQVETLGDSENATKQEHFQAKWKHLATRKMRPTKSLKRFR
jgi:hypothetical protein